MMTGILLSTKSIKIVWFKIIAVICTAGTLLLPLFLNSGYRLEGTLSLDMSRITTAAMIGLISVLILDRLSLIPSFCTAFLGAIEAYILISRPEYDFNISLATTWIAAPVLSFIIAALLYVCFRALFTKSGIHLISLAYWMRYLVIAAIIFSLIAAGINYGGLINNIAAALPTDTYLVSGLLVMVFACLSGVLVSCSDICAERHFGLSLQSVLSVGIAVPVSLLLFSIPEFCAIFHLQASPVSIASLSVAALLGVSLINGRMAVDPDTAWKTFAGLLLSPALSITIIYMGSTIFRINSGESYQLLIWSALFILFTLITVYYIHSLKNEKSKTERILSEQQAQLYENQKALNTMEMKAILSENYALHNTLEMKRKELMDVALSIGEQKEYLNRISERIEYISRCNDDEERNSLLAELLSDLKSRSQNDNRIDDFYVQVESLHKDFSVRMEEAFPNLTQQEKKLTILLRLGFSTKYISTLMYITPKSVEIARYRLRQKLGLKRDENLINFIKSI